MISEAGALFIYLESADKPVFLTHFLFSGRFLTEFSATLGAIYNR